MNYINGQFVISVLTIFLGYISKRLNLLSEKDGESISKVIFNFTLPSLIINTFSTVQVNFALGLLPVINIAYALIMVGTALIIFRNEQDKMKGMLLMAVPGFNIGLFIYPLVESIWGDEGLKTFAMFDMGNAFIVFGVCYIIAGYFSSSDTKLQLKEIVLKFLRSIPFLAYSITLIINLIGLRYPAMLLDITKVLAKANMPLSLLLLGVYMSFSIERSYWKYLLKMLGLRYFTGLTVGILLYLVMPYSLMFRYTLLVGFILPVGMVVIPYSVRFGYDTRFIGTLANLTNIISFVLVWIILAFITI